MMKKILVPLDGSKLAEQILPYARLLAEVYKVPVDLLCVDAFDAGATFSTSAGAMSYLKSVATEGFPQAARVDAVIEHGKAAEVIVERAKLEPGCLIAMGTHGRSGINRWLLGSVAAKVVQAAENPILLVRASNQVTAKSSVKIASIIVPLDGSELAESVLPAVLDLARSLNTEVVLARAFQLPATAYYRTDDVPAAAAPFIPSYDDVVAELKGEAQEYLAATEKKLLADEKVRVRAESFEGPAAERIIDLARNTTDSLIAMCTHGRSGLRRWMFGNVTEKVVRHAESPILIIRAR